MAFRGSCLCGAITFEVDQVVGPTEYCHCNRCRKVSGSSALLVVGVNTSDYRFLSGKESVRIYAAPILYKPPAYHTVFCSSCGCSVPPPEVEGDWLEIPVGLFDDEPNLKPDKHIYVELAPMWDEITDNLPQFTGAQLYKHRFGTDKP